MHLHLAYDRDTSPAGHLKRNQLWVNLASFRTFTATVNAASPAGLAQPSAPASGGSAIWDDYHRGQNRQFGGYGPYSAVRVAEAKEAETILYATQTVPQTNPSIQHRRRKVEPADDALVRGRRGGHLCGGSGKRQWDRWTISAGGEQRRLAIARGGK